jgi:putative transposase
LAPQETRTYFVTTVTANRRRLFQVISNADLMLEVLQHYRRKEKLALHAFVIMPDHLHLLMTPAFDSPWRKRCSS